MARRICGYLLTAREHHVGALKLIGGEAHPSFETPEIAFFPRNALPKLSAPRITEYQIEHMFEHAEHPEWPTTFD